MGSGADGLGSCRAPQLGEPAILSKRREGRKNAWLAGIYSWRTRFTVDL